MTRSRTILTEDQHKSFKHLCGNDEGRTTLEGCARCKDLLPCLLSHGIKGKDEMTQEKVKKIFPALEKMLGHMRLKA